VFPLGGVSAALPPVADLPPSRAQGPLVTAAEFTDLGGRCIGTRTKPERIRLMPFNRLLMGPEEVAVSSATPGSLPGETWGISDNARGGVSPVPKSARLVIWATIESMKEAISIPRDE
jgi:hypothetical protein